MLQTQHGGAAARPFTTHSNALDMDLFLRIAPELFLKRAVVGGLERVFEINRNFRNEGVDSSHSPEFAMLEFYQAYADYQTMATITRELIQGVARRISGSEQLSRADGSSIDLSGEWSMIDLYDSVSTAVGVDLSPQTPVSEVEKLCEQAEISVAPTHRSKPGVVEKWDLYVGGVEQATGYSELVDPVIQRDRLTEQASLAARGDDEAMSVDEDFLRALEHGMPPCGGVGLGIDRLLMNLTGYGIRETILFPLVKPERK